ncbi:lytic transglycosylase domain-containing protein [Marinicaulis aureus]|uniref:Lytic transglycosylase domain-containing protein n=1 Tax=Hyphococcus aureus TaxID=2666033 RepID=A0ABW1L0H6_9PROT
MSEVAPRIKPPAPGPLYMSRGDKERLLAAHAALKTHQFPTAISLISLVQDPIAKGLGEWMYFMAQDPAVDFNLADSFLDANPDWPARSRIHAWIEKKIPDSAPADQVLAFFDTREPVTGYGKLQLARALFAVGDITGGEEQLRDAWINSTFTLAEERRVLSSYGGRLTEKDHAARVDQLLWGRQVTNARRVFPYLDSHDRKNAEARAALLLQASSAQKMFDRLPEKDQLDSGMLHAAVRYHRRRGEEQYAMALAQLAPEDPAEIRDGGRWWDERNLLMRWALKNGRFADAYEVAAGHRMSEGADYAEAEFYAGWIALRFLNAPERAETHFLALASEVGSPISVSRAQYWLGRAAEAKGDTASANAYYANAAQHYYSYYGQLAAEKLGGAFVASKFDEVAQSSPMDRALFTSRPTVAALRMLTDLDLEYEFMVFAYHVDDQLERPGEYIELAKLTNGEGAPHLTVRAGKVAIQRGAFTPDVAYPLIFVPDEAAKFVSPEIILGLSRQESEFNPRAYSRAGARGVMQLIPTTAQITARKEGLVYSRGALLDDPAYNMTLGSAHLSHLIDRFDGSLVMTFAGYNAGAARVDQWVGDYGDPRSDSVDPLDWVELIPFSETRNYVQRVLENVQVYRGRLNEKPIPGKLAADIERGGARNRVANALAPSVVLANAASRFGQMTLPPVPARTEERARLYAMKNPPRMPGDMGAPLLAPDEAASASPIAFNAEGENQAEETKKNAKRRKKVVQGETPVPVLTPKPKSAEAPVKKEDVASQLVKSAKDAATEAAKLIVPPAAAEEPVAEAHIITPEAEPAAENDLVEDIIEEENLAENAGTVEGALIEDAADMPPMAEDEAEQVVDFSSPLSEQEYCLAYREFLLRNAEEGMDAAELNAKMLADLEDRGMCQ